MNKKLMALGAVLSVVASVAAMSAYEAHVINVTAKIENALSVPVQPIEFGTVFPQEKLYDSLEVALSGSFLAEDDVLGVQNHIRQKPKCGITTDNGTVLVGPTGTGEVIVNLETGAVTIYCGTSPRDLVGGETWGLLPSLCEYISKTSDGDDEPMLAFHKPYSVIKNDLTGYFELVWNDVEASLTKQGDEKDNWTIDLVVPCFEGQCAQDWETFVYGVNPNVNAWDYDLPANSEHMIFGCNIWVEVTGINRTLRTY